MTLSVIRSQVHHIYTAGTRESQISLRSALRSLVLQATMANLKLSKQTNKQTNKKNR